MLTNESALRKDKTTGTGVRLEHRHFAFIASVLAQSKPGTPNALLYWHADVTMWADACGRIHPRFDRARFLHACGVE